MSGGHWDYVQHTITGGLEDVSIDIKDDMPELSRVLEKMSDKLANVLHNLDWHYSGDTEIDDFAEFERTAIKKLRDLLI